MSLLKQSSEYVSEIERVILTHPVDLKVAREMLKEFLRSEIGDEASNSSIADMLEALAKRGDAKDAARLIIRCLSVDGLVPDKSASANITRAVVTVCENELPKLMNYLRIEGSSQSFEKYAKLSSAHREITSLLLPLHTGLTSIESALDAKGKILGCLSHGVLASYIDIFGLSEVKLIVDTLYDRLRAISLGATSLSDDVQSCRNAIAAATLQAEQIGTFLSREYLLPFIRNVDRIVQDFSESFSDRFATDVLLVHEQNLPKRYPLHLVGKDLKVSIPFKNLGPGKLVDLIAMVSADGESVEVANDRIILGDITPGNFSVVLDIGVKASTDSLKLLFQLEWREVGGVQAREELYEISVSAQPADVDFLALEHWSPYTTGPAQGSEFVGRQDLVKKVASKILRAPMEPFYITGQKRVGKTSLIEAAVDFAKKQANGGEIYSHYVLWGSIAYENPHATLRELGSHFEECLRSQVDLRGVNEIDCSESLAPLIKLCTQAYNVCPEKKFVFIIDEFDELHQEFYLRGNLAETFFANLRALTRCRNVCIALVGGENMPYVMERQGQKLNNFSKLSLSYYDRARDWSDYRLLVTSPTYQVIEWHEDAVSEIFNSCNGNPYFTKIICAAVLARAIHERDMDITSEEVKSALDEEVSQLGANSFAHLWQDGIAKPMEEREPEILARIRVLLAIARAMRARDSLTLPKIMASRIATLLTEAEAQAVLNDFVRREVLREDGGVYHALLPIFLRWLEDVGVTQLAETSLSVDLAQAVLDAENAAAVKSEEIAKLVRNWPTYRGRHIGSDEVRGWLQQAIRMQDQRILFKILQNMYFFTDILIRERLASLHSIAVLPHLAEFVKKRNSDRRRDVVVTYVDGEGKSGSTYASYYAEQNMIASDCIVPPGEFSSRLAKLRQSGTAVSTIVIVDDLAATGRTLVENIDKFIEANLKVISELSLKIVVGTIASTATGRDAILKSFERFEGIDIDFRTAEIIDESFYAFRAGGKIWASDLEMEVAKTLATDLGIRVYGKKNPLGYGGMALLVIFSNSIPNNSLPILHSPSRISSPEPWTPLFRRIIK